MTRAPATRPSAALRDSFVALLRIPTANLAKEKVDGYLYARLVGLGHGKTCPRCGGSGHYSSNAIDGTRCFGCRGACYVAPSLTPDLYARVESDVRDGKLDTYLAELRERRTIEKETRFAPDRVLDAWSATGISKVYGHSKAARGIQPDKDLADLINQPMCDAYRTVHDLSGGLDSLFFHRKKAKTSEATAEIDTRIAETRRAIVSATAAAMETIKEKAALIPEILARHPSKPAPPAAAIDDSPSP